MKWTIAPITEYESLRKDWDLLNATAGNSPLLDSRFISPLLQCFGTGKEMLGICHNEGKLCAFTIISKHRTGSWQTFQPSQAPIGCWLQDRNYSTEQLALTLRQALPGVVLVLGISQQDPAFLPRPKSSKRLSTLDYIETARVTVSGSFEEYWAARGKNLRQNLRRQRNRLARENVEATLAVITGTNEIHDAIQAYGALESAGWKAGMNTAIHIDNAQGRFYKAMLESFSKTNQAIVFQYYYNCELVATDLCIIGSGCLIILKTTYNEEINTSSPAMLMREDAFNYVFTHQLAKQIEFYGKVMDWHTRWSNDFRCMYHLNCTSSAMNILQSWKSKLRQQDN